ncbi:MAG: flagellar biosynthesis protein FlhB [Myxococcota bacterium]
MAENKEGQEKKHAATDKKRRDASEKGQIAKSQDLTAFGVLAASALALLAGGGWVGAPMLGLGLSLWDLKGPQTLEMNDATAMFATALWAAAGAMALPLGAAAMGALLLGVAQSQLRMAPKALEPKLDKLNPINGFKQNYFSWTPLVELGKGLGKLVLLGGVVTWGVWDRVGVLPELASADVRGFMEELVDLTGVVVLLALPVVLVLGAADYAYQAWKTSDDLKMTDEEMKQQHKEQDGDPQWKGRRRQRQRQLAMGTLVQALGDADVIVTNPTHFAVALRYKRDVDAAPVVVAKGVDHRALHIRALAKDMGIPRIEDRPLARGLHANVPVGHPVPEEWYGPVARVLAVVYRRRRKVLR